jgi:hypothetical protein
LLFPFHALLALPPLWKGVAAGLTMSLPVLFSGLVFIVVFARAQAPDAALGSNILGAIAGGASECLSFLVGINALGLVAMGFYALSLVCLVRRKQLRC